MTKTHLVVQEALLHAIVGADLLQDIPGELPVELVGDGTHADGDHADDGGDGDEEGLAQLPHIPVLVILLQGTRGHQVIDRVVDLIDLEDGVDENGQVSHAEADDLNGILESQGVPGQDQDVEETEDEKGEEGRNRAILRLEFVGEAGLLLVLETELEPPEDVSALSCVSTETMDGLYRTSLATQRTGVTRLTTQRRHRPRPAGRRQGRRASPISKRGSLTRRAFACSPRS